MRKYPRELANPTTDDDDELLEGVDLEQDLEQVEVTLEEVEFSEPRKSVRRAGIPGAIDYGVDVMWNRNHKDGDM